MPTDLQKEIQMIVVNRSTAVEYVCTEAGTSMVELWWGLAIWGKKVIVVCWECESRDQVTRVKKFIFNVPNPIKQDILKKP